MSDLVEEKQRVRTEALEARDAITPEQRNRKSARVCVQLQEIAEGAASETGDDVPTVAVYQPMRSEVDVSDFTDWAYAHGWHVAFPCMMKRSEATEEGAAGLPIMRFRCVPHYVYEGTRDCFLRHPLKSYTADDPALKDTVPVAPQEVTLVIVPLVAFDGELKRLGYGGGCYDRFLPKLRPEAVTCGVAFKEQQVVHVPTEDHDIALSQLVSA